ncbi:Leucine Rich Repeat family protein [Aphelenchoides avenae]|nr:Leucine Rich Repeat family protein [Aphelenchus avenae]
MASNNATIIKDFKRQIDAAQRKGNRTRVCALHNEFAEWYNITGNDPDAARNEYLKAAELAEEISNWNECAMAYRNLTDLALDKQQFDDARKYVVKFAGASTKGKNIAFQQQASHTYALVYLRMATSGDGLKREHLNKALENAKKCKAFTEKHRREFSSQDGNESGGGFENKMAALNQLMADICFESGDEEGGRQYSQMVKDYASRERDYDLLFRALWSEYIAQPGSRKLQLILEAYDVYKKMKANGKSQIFEAIADDCPDELFPFAIKQYTNMLDNCASMARKASALESIAVTASNCQDYETAYVRFGELLELEQRRGRSADKLLETQLWMLRSMAHLGSYAYQDKIIALDKVAPKCYTNKQKLRGSNGKGRWRERKKELNAKNSELSALGEDETDEDEDRSPAPAYEDEYTDKSDAALLNELRAEMKEREEQQQIRSDVNKKINPAGETNLHLAAKVDKPDYVKKLLDMGYDPNQPDNGGWTPFSEAVSHGLMDNVLVILEHSRYPVKLNVKSTEIQVNHDDLEATGAGLTPLMEACVNGYVEIARLLIEKGASVAARNDDDWTALDFLRLHNTEFPGNPLVTRFMQYLEQRMRAQGVNTAPGPPRQKKVSVANKPKEKLRRRRGYENLVDDSNIGDSNECVNGLVGFKNSVGPRGGRCHYVGDTVADDRDEATAEDLAFIAPEEDDPEEPILAPRTSRRPSADTLSDEDIMNQDDRNFQELFTSDGVDTTDPVSPPPKRSCAYRSRSGSPIDDSVPSSSRGTRSSRRRSGASNMLNGDRWALDDQAGDDGRTPRRRKRSFNGSIASTSTRSHGGRSRGHADCNDENSFAQASIIPQNPRRRSSPSVDSAFEGSGAQLHNEDGMTAVSDTIRRPMSRLELASNRSSHSGSGSKRSSSGADYLPVIVDVEFVEDKWRLAVHKALKLHWTRARTIGDLKSECREKVKDLCSDVVIEYRDKTQEDDSSRMAEYCASGKENVRFTVILSGWTCPSLKDFYKRWSDKESPASKLVEAALDAAESTQRIDLSFSPPSLFSDTALVATLAASSCRIPPIRKLNLQGTNLPKKDDVLRSLAPVFSQLHELDLTSSGVDDVIIEKLLHVAETCMPNKIIFPSLKQLSLGFNTFSAATCAKLLQRCSQLSVLDLSSVAIVESSDDDVDAFFQSICGIQSLVKLRMNACSFLTDAHAEAVMNSCKQLKELDFSRANLTSIPFKKDMALAALRLSGIPSMSARQEVLDELATAENLSQLDLSHTKVLTDWHLLETFLRRRLSVAPTSNAPKQFRLKLHGIHSLDDHALAEKLAAILVPSEPMQDDRHASHILPVHLTLPRSLTNRLLAIRPELYEVVGVI